MRSVTLHQPVRIVWNLMPSTGVERWWPDILKTDDYISSQLSSSFQTRELPNPLSATSATPTLNNRGLHPVSPHERSNPLPTYTTAPRERCLGPGTSSEKRNSSPSYPMSSPNNGDKNSNPSQELISPLPTYSTAPRGRKGLELGSSVRTSSSHPYPMSSPNSGDQDSNPRKASTNSLPTYSTLPRANSLPVCTMSSPNSADRDSNPRQESTSYLPTYSTAPRANPFTACTTPHSPHSAAERRQVSASSYT
jgi:hypothetical protein